nr:DUF5058 family protein [Geomicrobium halophilum]
MTVANSIPLWIIAFLVVALVIFQAVIFLRITTKTAPNVGMSANEVRSAVKTGVISSIGPSFGIAIVVVALITLIGSPLTLMRIGIIGSAATETAAAGIGAQSFGVQLGGDDFTTQALTNVVWTMCLGGTGWLIFTALFTKSLGNIQKRVAKKSAKTMATVSLAAMLGVFGFLTSEEMMLSVNHTITAIVAAGSMVIIMGIAEKTKTQWLKEWALGFALIIGMSTGYLSTLI